jgi:hypothetical protein
MQIRETGYTPPRTAHVVRGGRMQESDLRKTATNCLTKHGILGITIWIAEVPSVEELVSQAGHFVKIYSRLSVCSLAVLEDYRILPTAQAPH